MWCKHFIERNKKREKIRRERKEESKENGENYDQVEERKRLIAAAHTRLRAAVFVSNVRCNAAIDLSCWQWTDTEWIRLRPSKIYILIELIN